MSNHRRAQHAVLMSSVLAVSVIVSLATFSSGAFVMNTATAEDNAVQLSTLDAALSEIGPATENSTTDETSEHEIRKTWVDYSHQNQSTDPVNNTVRIENQNPSAASHLNITVSYAQNDSGVNDVVDDSVETASSLNVSVLEYNGTDLLAERVTDANGNGALDLDDVANANLTRLSGIPPGQNVTLVMSISGDSSQNDNVAGGDGVEITITIELVGKPSWRDSDRSVENTIQYAA